MPDAKKSDPAKRYLSRDFLFNGRGFKRLQEQGLLNNCGFLLKRFIGWEVVFVRSG